MVYRKSRRMVRAVACLFFRSVSPVSSRKIKGILDWNEFHKMKISGKEIELDDEGWLKKFDDWDMTVAKLLAAANDVLITKDHIRVIALLQFIYTEYGELPNKDRIKNLIIRRVGNMKNNHKKYMKMFPDGIDYRMYKIAGVPKSCIKNYP